MIRRVFAIAAAISLLLCPAVVVWRVCSAPPNPHDKPAHPARGSESRPASAPSVAAADPLPPSKPAPHWVELALADRVPKIANSQLEWGVEIWGFEKPIPMTGEAVQFTGPAETLDDACQDFLRRSRELGITRKRLMRPLLRALDSSNQFVVAHAVLSKLWRRAGSTTVDARNDGTYVEHFDGLEVVLTPQGEAALSSGPAVYYCRARIDPSQMPAIKRQWVARLAREDGN